MAINISNIVNNFVRILPLNATYYYSLEDIIHLFGLHKEEVILYVKKHSLAEEITMTVDLKDLKSNINIIFINHTNLLKILNKFF